MEPFNRHPVKEVIEAQHRSIDKMYDQKIREIERSRELAKKMATVEIKDIGRKIQDVIAREKRPCGDAISTRLLAASKPIDSVCMQMIMGGDLWELIYPNDLEFQDVINLGITCKYATQNLLFGWWWKKIIQSYAIRLQAKTPRLTLDRILEDAYSRNFIESSRKRGSILLFSKRAPLLEMRPYCMRCVKTALSCEHCTLNAKNPGPHDIFVRIIGKHDNMHTKCQSLTRVQENDYKWPPTFKCKWELFDPKGFGRSFSKPKAIFGCTFSYNRNDSITIKPQPDEIDEIFLRYDSVDREEIILPSDSESSDSESSDSESTDIKFIRGGGSVRKTKEPKRKKQPKRKREPSGEDSLVIKRRKTTTCWSDQI